MVNTAVGLNPTFAADNVFFGAGSIGLYGRSRGTSFSIGVMGQSPEGCGQFGLATDENSALAVSASSAARSADASWNAAR